MNKKIGIRHEDKYELERRTAIPPFYAKKLIEENGYEVLVEKSKKRIFKDAEYEAIGAKLVDDMRDADVIFGVKEMPIDYFKADKTYVFFSHTVKGQKYNMPLLKNMMEKKCNLIDYEKIAEDDGRRIIFFGRFAGLAGMVNSLWSFGQRMKVKGLETPFVTMKQAHKYNSLEEIKNVISEIGASIAEKGFSKEIFPMVVGFTGYGNVSRGAAEILALFPVKEITPEELLVLKERDDLSNRVVYKVIFKEEHISKPIDKKVKFELQDYYNNPQKYKNAFEKFVPNLTILMNCMYWDASYPRIITKDFLEKLYSKEEPKLKVIGDVTCDPGGSIESTHTGTLIEDPVFVYNPITRKPTMGFEGDGILEMAVDILPSELPRESSEGFGQALELLIPSIVSADYNLDFASVNLPLPIKRAVILYKGKLTPEYEYLKDFL
ncbi:MAG: bifunctional lysine ketoglutarate reductase /saccharopine dehydrogenase family protein [Bacteroidota bacterium]|nr:bifunctional lysine ketoglutarate reductase /saccharopine dehydrogenase family protein [Bacteroidota bacterium]